MYNTNHEAIELFGAGFGDPCAARKEAAAIFEAAGGDIETFATQQLRAQAMSAALSWVEGGDFSYLSLEDTAIAMADLDESGDLSDDESEFLDELLAAIGDALIFLGGEPVNVTTFLDEEDDAAGATLGAFLSDSMAAREEDDSTLIADYAVVAEQVMEAVIKVVRAGKVTFKKKRIKGRHVKMNAMQRASLKKARSKAFTGAAMAHRKKSMHLRKKMGL